jgi:hypothetical protein
MRVTVRGHGCAAVGVAAAQGGIGFIGNGGIMSLQSHLETLKERHAFLETRIADEDQRPRPDTEALTRLKLEKLRLKDEMERLRVQNN